MSHFYGTIEGRGNKLTTKTGHKSTGLIVHAASYEGCIKTELYHKEGKDYCRISFKPWQGQGANRIIYEGLISGKVE